MDPTSNKRTTTNRMGKNLARIFHSIMGRYTRKPLQNQETTKHKHGSKLDKKRHPAHMGVYTGTLENQKRKNPQRPQNESTTKKNPCQKIDTPIQKTPNTQRRIQISFH